MSPHPSLRAGAVCAVLFLTAMARPCPAGQADWPCFRGPNRDGKSAETGLAPRWPASGPRLIADFDRCGRGFACVAIANDRIVTAGNVDGSTILVALDRSLAPVWTATNGQGRWRVPPDKKDWAHPYDGTRSTPTIADGRVFHLSEVGRLAAYDLGDGKELWALDLTKTFRGKPNEWGYTESVLVVGDHLYCQPGGADGYVVCLEAGSGRVLWADRSVADHASNASAVIAEIGGVRQFVTMTTLYAVGLRAEDGKLLWRHRHANRFRENCETPLWSAGTLYLASGYGHGSEGLRLKRLSRNAFTASLAWRCNEADNLHGGPIILDGCVYGTGYDHRGAFCLDLADGRFRWRNPAIGRSSFCYADGRLYALEESGLLRLVEPSPEAWKEVSSFRLPQATPDLFMTHPVVCGRLYVRHHTRLYCYDLSPRPDP